jgi:metal-responsive CopG/Arc/MetJ family transcriptional regulator
MPKYKKEGIKTARIGVVLPEEVREKLEEIADKRGWSLSQTAALAIQEWLNTLNKE